MMSMTYSYSWDNSLDGQFQIVGHVNGLPIIVWKKPQAEEMPNNLIKAILTYEIQKA